MFRGCTALVTAPSLPATTLASSCYSQMFQECTALTVAPDLPAVTIVNSCYKQMFNGCTALVHVPRMYGTAHSLAGNCYSEMFNECVNLEELPALPIQTKLPASCYASMFAGCTKIKISQTQTGDYVTPYRIPTTGTGTVAGSGQFTDMFKNTGGSFKSTPTINTTYYTSNTVISVT